MRWMEIRVDFQAPDRDLAVDLIADRFYALGLAGVVEEGGAYEPADWADGAPPRPAGDAVVGYLAETEGVETLLSDLREGLDRLTGQGITSRITFRRVDEEDWAESWKAYFRPERIGERLVVKPTWRDFDPRPGDLVLAIDPGMAFGTGTHPTTAMCLRLLERHLRPGDGLLDVGTGSGILLAAGALLGAGRLRGTDVDPVAVTVATENLALNGVPAERYSITAGPLTEGITGRYEAVTANILTDVILTLLDRVERVTAPGGLFIGSGILAGNGPQVGRRMEARGFTVLERLVEDGWTALAGRRREA